MVASDHVLPYFTAFRNPLSPLYQNAFEPTFPNDFVADIAAGSLPSVSWIIPPLGFDEHPSSAPANGMYFTSLVLDALTANTELWSKTALFLMYDENDGWFDHVPPPTAPAGTPGEYLTATPSSTLEPGNSSQTLGITGPLGLGMRVPMLVISPFSRGGHIASQTFDHTSQLQLVAARFGVEVPNVSAWRRATVGDLTSTMFQSPPSTKVPALPAHRRVHAAHGSVRRGLPGHRDRGRLTERADQADDADPGRQLRAGVEVLPDDRRPGSNPRRAPHLAELPLARVPDDEVAPESPRRAAAHACVSARAERRRSSSSANEAGC